MNMFYSVYRRLHRIVAMPEFVMGEDSPQQIQSTPLLESSRAMK